MKNLKAKTCKKEQFSEWEGWGWSEGRRRERRYADFIFVQIYFRIHHFVVIIFFASGGKGALTP